MTGADLASRIDHTLLKAGAGALDIERHCREAIENRFRGVCVLPGHLPVAAPILEGSGVILSAAIAFPHGASTRLGKIFESLEAWKGGARELDIVIDLSAVADGDPSRVEAEVRDLMDKVPECAHKFIVETGMFDRERLLPIVAIMNQRRPAFVKTSTGVNARGASPEDVAFLREALHRSIGVKASGGIRTAEQAAALLAAGASVLGTSAGVAILREHGGR